MIYNLQVLRAVAAYLVVFYHLEAHINRTYPGALQSHVGASGVDIFFVLSGFIMLYTNRDCDSSPGQFWRSRIVRIFPLYWFLTFVMISVTLLGFAPSGLHHWSGQDLLASLLLVPRIRADGVAEPILSQAWTLIYEVFFYLVFGLLLLSKRTDRIVAILAVLFASLALVGWAVKPTGLAAKVYTSAILMEFVAGCLLAEAYIRMRMRPWIVGLGWPFVIAGAAAIVLGDQFLRGLFAEAPEWRLGLYGIPAVMIVAGALILEKGGRRFANHHIQLQGAASYALYLSHTLTMHIVFKMAAAITAVSALFCGIIGVAAFAFAIVMATLLHIWVERPLGRGFKALIDYLPLLRGASNTLAIPSMAPFQREASSSRS